MTLQLGNTAIDWSEWQSEVVSVVRTEFRTLFHGVQGDDFDWDAWRPLFDDGHAPEGAVKQALSKTGLQSRTEEESGAVNSSVYEPAATMHMAVD